VSLKRSAKSPYWRDELLDLEQRLLDPSVRGSPQAVVPLLHPDFVEFGSSGRVYTKELMVQMMLQQAPGVVRIRDFDVREIAPEAALVTYRTVGAEGKETRRSSIWVRSGGEWRIVFHQGTRVHARLEDGQVS
jgi:ribonuclease HI